MAALSTVRDGDWANTTGGVTPWTALTGAGAGGVPGNGDTITFSNAVTWAPSAGSSVSIGTGSGVAATFNVSGKLTLTPAGSFTWTWAGSTAGSASNGRVTSREFVVNATNGAITINIDATGAGAGFAMLVGNTYDNGSSPYNDGGWALNGNATYGITVASLPSDGSKNSHFAGGSFGGRNMIDASYVTFRRIGTSSQAGFAPNMDTRNKTCTWSNVTLDSCGQVTLSGDGSWTAGLAWTDVVSTNTLTDASASWPFNFSFGAAGTARSFTRCVADKSVKHGHMRSFSYSACYFHNGWAGTDVTSVWGGVDGCFIRQTFDSMITAGNVTNSFLYWDNPSGNNPHFLSGTTNPSGTVTFNWSNNIAYYNGADAAGNVFLTPITTNGSLSYTLNNNLVLPNSAGLASGTFLTSNGNTANGFTITANHNTIHTKGCHAFEIGHLRTAAESPNRYAAVKSNLILGGTTGYKAYNVDGDSDSDLMTPGNVDYNGSYQIKATSGAPLFTNEGRGYAATWSTTPGAHDMDGTDPAFVNGSASLAGWDLSLGGPGTDTAAAARIQANPSLISTLTAYLAAAYRPTATAYHGTAHDAGDVGAFAWVSAGTVPYGYADSLSGGLQTMGF